MRSRRTQILIAGVGAALLACFLFPPAVSADHSLGLSCYLCHDLKSTTVWRDTKSIDTSRPIGKNREFEPGNHHPLYCDFCHTGYADEFTPAASPTFANISSHPVKIISADTYCVNDGSTCSTTLPATTIGCADCHGGNTVTTGPMGNFNPDVAPLSYDPAGLASLTDGYPNHDVQAFTDADPVKFVPAWDAGAQAGADPHPTDTFNHVASTDPATDYALCFSCHSAAGIAAADIETPYLAGGGHFFKSDSARIGCMDCHDTHGSESIKLYNRATSPILAAADDGYSICINCHRTEGHTGYSGRTVTPVTIPTTGSGLPGEDVPAHQSGSEADCTGCHDPHAPAPDRSDCFDCHGNGGSLVASLGAAAIVVDDGAGDDFGYGLGDNGRHDITFANDNSGHCLECHVIVSGSHADGDTSNDLKYNGSNGPDWQITGTVETGGDFASSIEFCLGCHGETASGTYWGQTPPDIDTLVDWGTDGTDGITNNYGHGDAAVGDYAGQTPTYYDTLRTPEDGPGHDPPATSYDGVPMFAHYTQGNTDASNTNWWALGSTSTQPQPFPCLDCHFAHGSDNDVLYRSPQGTGGVGSEKYGTYRTMCLNCHNGSDGLEGRTAPNPETGPLNDRYNFAVEAHDSGSGLGCSPSATSLCHNPHAPSCEICHGYPP